MKAIRIGRAELVEQKKPGELEARILHLEEELQNNRRQYAIFKSERDSMAIELAILKAKTYSMRIMIGALIDHKGAENEHGGRV